MSPRLAALLLLLSSSAGAWSWPWSSQPPVVAFKSVFGWEGEQHPAIAYEDGSFFVHDGLNKVVGFKVSKGAKSLRWRNHSGYLPCLVTELEKKGLSVKVSDFADKVAVDGHDYAVAYARVELTNKKPHDVWVDPGASRQLVVLSSAEYLAPGQTADYDYAIELDRFGKPSPRLSAQELRAQGGWDEHFKRMKRYWDAELSGIARLATPRRDLDDSYKAGYIYTQIIKEGHDLKTGAQDYGHVYDHDANGILSGLFAVGDFRQARELLENLPVSINYDDGRWLYPWPWAFYAFQTGDLDFVRAHWKKISEVAHQIAADRTGPGGIMKKTGDIDTDGYWLTDGWSAMIGLLSYSYLARRLGQLGEADWARAQYASLLSATLDTARGTMRNYGLSYLPTSVLEPDERNRTKAPDDSNWASAVAGVAAVARLGGELPDEMRGEVDATYDFGLSRAAKAGLPPGDFGGFPGYSSTYNAAWAAGGLYSRRHRDLAIEAYEFLLDNAQSGPYSWWEGIFDPAPSAWEGRHPRGGDGDCPHMWGQAMNVQAVLAAVASESFDGALTVGRGVPDAWLDSGKPVELRNFPVSRGRRIGVRIQEASPGVYDLSLSGDALDGPVVFDLPAFSRRKIAFATAGSVPDSGDRVVLDPGAREVQVTAR